MHGLFLLVAHELLLMMHEFLLLMEGMILMGIFERLLSFFFCGIEYFSQPIEHTITNKLVSVLYLSIYRYKCRCLFFALLFPINF